MRLALGMLALLAALLMLGLDVPTPRPAFAEVHRPLMVFGFLGTLIALERTVAVDVPAGYVAPALAGGGVIAPILGLPLIVAQILLGLGGIGLLSLHIAAARPDPHRRRGRLVTALRPG